MIITCFSNSGKDLMAGSLEIGNTSKTEFHVTPGLIYNVYGIAMYAHVLMYLIFDDSGRPDWYPTELFTLSSRAIPGNWEFVEYVRDNKSLLSMLIGYPELCTLDGHYDDLIEGDSEALSVFWKRKQQIDRFCSSET